VLPRTPVRLFRRPYPAGLAAAMNRVRLGFLDDPTIERGPAGRRRPNSNNRSKRTGDEARLVEPRLDRQPCPAG
jgi:hypothetical protein